jgi:hypothetical protein
LSLDQQAAVLRAETADEQRLLREHIARWSPRNNVIELQSRRKSLKTQSDDE